MHPMTNETCTMSHARPPKGARISLHGYPMLQLQGRVAPLPLKHGLALLAYLADHPHRVGRDTLAALLWPDAAPGVARTRLRRLVHAVHERVGRTLVCGDHDALWLVPDLGSDLCDTEGALACVLRGQRLDLGALQPLLAPQAGQLLTGFALDSDAFDDWLAQRRRVQHVRLSRALRRAIELARAADDRAAAQAAACALLRLEPYDELPLAA
jgi:DNA-binding SARP family transcriptional activator